MKPCCLVLSLSLSLSFPCACTEAVVNDISGENKAGAADVSASQHVMVCALKELGSLVQSLSATASPLIQEPSIGETNNCNSQTNKDIKAITPIDNLALLVLVRHKSEKMEFINVINYSMFFRAS